MSDDPEQIRTQARRATRLAADARAAATAVSGGQAVRWYSEGAERYRERLRERAAEFRSRADDLDGLSRLLLSHARHVEDHERALAALAGDLAGLPGAGASAVHDAVDSGRRTLGDGGRAVGERVGGVARWASHLG